MNRANLQNYTVDCNACTNGLIYEYGVCTKPSSRCCGGCSDEYECELCNGTGLLNYHPEIHELFQDHYTLSNWDKSNEDMQGALSVIEKSITYHYEQID